MHIRPLLSLAALLMASAGVSAQQTQRLTASKVNDYGIVYSLPKTVVDVTVEASVTERKPGEFYLYAKKYLNADNPITTPSVSADIVSVVLTSRGVANTDERYMITLKSNFSPYVILSADNIPLSINTEEVFTPEAVELPQGHSAEPTPLETAAAGQVMTEEMLRSHSSAKRAELAAEQIYALRQSRTDLITGQADQMPPDGQAMQLVLDNIDAQERALTAMFLGTESTRTEVRTFTIDPSEDVTNSILARISPTGGVVAPSDLSGAPVYVSVRILSRGELPVNEKGERLTFPKNGVAYCIPGRAEVTVEYDNRKVTSAEFNVAQLGVVYGMAPTSFTDKKNPVGIVLDPTSGALVRTLPVTLR